MFPVMGQSPPPVETPNQIAPFSLATGEALALRVYIDKSVLEVYANVSRLSHRLHAVLTVANCTMRCAQIVYRHPITTYCMLCTGTYAFYTS